VKAGWRALLRRTDECSSDDELPERPTARKVMKPATDNIMGQPRSTLSLGRILSLEVRERGFGFAIIERGVALRGCGTRGRNTGEFMAGTSVVQKLTQLLQVARADLVVMGSPETARARSAARLLAKTARERELRVERISRKALLATFPDCNKHEIAVAIGKRFPCMAGQVPPNRRPWQSEYYWTIIFDAIASGLTFLRSAGDV
jgi:hypothetical protein